MDEDCLIPPETHLKNVIESVSGICNVDQRASNTCMYSGAHNAIFGANHQITRPRQGTSRGSNKKDLMIAKFLGWGINVSGWFSSLMSMISMDVMWVKTSWEVCRGRC
jgi:hypothetical protein